MRKAKREGAGDPEVLFLGLEGSGKSLLVRRLKFSLARRAVAKKSKGNQVAGSTDDAVFSTDVVPTIGVNVDSVRVGKKATLKLREVGGAMKPLWPTYLKACAATVYCVDVSTESTLAASAVEMARLAEAEALRAKPCLVVLTKTDAPMTMTSAEVQTVAPLGQIGAAREGDVKVFAA